MNKLFFNLLLVLLITATAVAAEIKPVGGFATSNVCSSVSSSSPNILISQQPPAESWGFAVPREGAI
jgi:hypothetical protein